MRFSTFNTGGRSRAFAAFGAQAGNTHARVMAASAKAAPDYAKLAQTQLNIDAALEKNAIKEEADFRKRAQNNIATKELNDNTIKSFKDNEGRKDKQRLAGGLAGIGAMAGVGYLTLKDNTKNRPLPSNSDASRSLINDYIENISGINTRRESAIDSIEFAPVDIPSSTSLDTSKSTTLSSNNPSKDVSDGWARWRHLIKTGEGTLGEKGYTTMYTGSQFTDLSKHPAKLNRSGRFESDAAGAYQFLSTTYNPAAKALGITDFSPESQEKVGKYLAQKRGLAVDTVFTDKASFLKELDKISGEWASMPTLATGTSAYGQGGLSPDKAWEVYQSFGR